jgi:hypothetical protein
MVQTILITHDAFATFGYGFGDLSALANLRLYWLTIPVMGGLGISSSDASLNSTLSLLYSVSHCPVILRLPDI